MTKRIKFLFGSIVLALGFLFCVVGLSVNAETEAEQPATDETQEVVNEEVTETTEQQEVVENTEQQEQEQPTEEEVVEKVNSALAWLKQIDAESVKGWLIAIASYLGANILVLLALVIKLVLSKTKEYKQTEFWNQVVAKMDQEHQEKVEKLVEEFNTKMVELQDDLKQEMAKLDDEKKKVAANNIALLKDNLQDIKEDLEK